MLGHMKTLWIFLGRHCKTELFFLSSFQCILGSVLKVDVRNGNIFEGLLKLKSFFCVCLIFLLSLGVNSRCWVQAYVVGK